VSAGNAVLVAATGDGSPSASVMIATRLMPTFTLAIFADLRPLGGAARDADPGLGIDRQPIVAPVFRGDRLAERRDPLT
jgi:hypothetical protein